MFSLWGRPWGRSSQGQSLSKQHPGERFSHSPRNTPGPPLPTGQLCSTTFTQRQNGAPRILLPTDQQCGTASGGISALHACPPRSIRGPGSLNVTCEYGLAETFSEILKSRVPWEWEVSSYSSPDKEMTGIPFSKELPNYPHACYLIMNTYMYVEQLGFYH